MLSISPVVVHAGDTLVIQQTVYVAPTAVHVFAAVILTARAGTDTAPEPPFGIYVKQFPGNISLGPVTSLQTYNLTQHIPEPGEHVQHHLPFTSISVSHTHSAAQASQALLTQPCSKLFGHHVHDLNAVAAHPAALPNVVPEGFNLPAVSVTTIFLSVVPRAVPISGIQLAAVPVFTVAAVPKAVPEPFAPAHATQRAEGALLVSLALSVAHPVAAKKAVAAQVAAVPRPRHVLALAAVVAPVPPFATGIVIELS